MKKTVLHIMNYAASYRGNFMESIESLQEKIEQDNLDIFYLFTSSANNEKARVWIDEMRRRGREVAFLTGRFGEDIRIIKGIVNEKNVSMVHTHFIDLYQYMRVYVALLGRNVQILMHMHNHSKEVRNLLLRAMRRFVYGKSRMIACSESVYRSLERDFPKNDKVVINNGINYSRLDKYEYLSPESFGFNNCTSVFLIFGFDFYRKGVDIAITALDKLRKEGKEFGLLISLSTNFKEVEDNVIKIIGFMPDWIKIIPARNDVATLYNSVDLFLSPSREEGMPYSVLEAGYCSCGVVMSDIAPQKNLKIPHGVWCHENSADDCAVKIVEALSALEEKRGDMEAVRLHMKESYDIDSWSNGMHRYYRECLKDR